MEDLYALINCVGNLDNGKFIKNIDTNVSLKDIFKYLRRETKQCEIRIELSRFNIVTKWFISILKTCHNDPITFDLLIRLLMNLTQPAFVCFKQELPTDTTMMGIYVKVDEILQNYKSYFADAEVLQILASHMKIIFNKDWEDRSEDDHMVVERILIFIRNILHIKTPNVDRKTPDGITNQHDELVLALLTNGWSELLIYLSNTESESRFAFHTLEIISLIFKEQKCDFMRITDQETSIDLSRNHQSIREQQLEEIERSTINPRALRFGGTFELRNIITNSGRPMIYHHDVSTGKIDLNMDRKQRRKPKNRLPIRTEIYYHKSSQSVLNCLQEFCHLFLENGYNCLMAEARAALLRNQKLVGDETYYLWTLRFFTSVCRIVGCDPDLVSETMCVEVFHWVHGQATEYLEAAVSEPAQAKSMFLKLHMAMDAYKSMLEFLLMLDRHKDEKCRKWSASIKRQVFYQAEYIDIYPNLLSKFTPSKQSRAQLRDLIEGSYLLIKILKNHQSFDLAVVQKSRIKKRAKHKPSAKPKQPAPETVVPMPGDSAEELLPLWAMLLDDLRLAVSGQCELPDHTALPCLYDPLLPEQREPIEPGTEPIDSQLKIALGLVQARLRQTRVTDAVAILRLARDLWPDEGRIAIGDEDGDDLIEAEILLLKDLMLAPKFYRDCDVAGSSVTGELELPEIANDDENDSELDDDQHQLVTKEHAFDLNSFLAQFCHPRIVTAYGIVFDDFATNPASTNRSLIGILHQIAEKLKRPYVLYQLRLFAGFAKFLEDPLSRLPEFKEMHKFVIFLTRKFTENVAINRKLLVEILFHRNERDAYEAAHGYEEYDEEDKSKKWTSELDDELTRLFEEAKLEQILPGLDEVNVVENRLSDRSKTRRQIIGRLINLGLIKSIKDLKRKKRNHNPWAAEEQARLVILFEESRDQPNPIKDIMNGLKAIADDPTNVRSRRVVVQKLLELGLVENALQLGIKPKMKKLKASNDSSSDEGSDNEEMGNERRSMRNYLNRSSESDNEMEVPVTKRQPPTLKTKRMIDWTALKMTYARLEDNEKEWFIEMLSDNIDSRANGIVGALALVPLQETESEILERPLVQKLLHICCLLLPDRREGHHFWRVPDDMSAKELGYFHNCVTSLSADELVALTMTEFGVVDPEPHRPPQPIVVRSADKSEVVRAHVAPPVELEHRDKENDDVLSASALDSTANALRAARKRSLKMLALSSDSDSDDDDDLDQHQSGARRELIELNVADEDVARASTRRVAKRAILDSDSDEIGHETDPDTPAIESVAPIKRSRIFDDGDSD